jgi:hypothetical protein
MIGEIIGLGKNIVDGDFMLYQSIYMSFGMAHVE